MDFLKRFFAFFWRGKNGSAEQSLPKSAPHQFEAEAAPPGHEAIPPKDLFETLYEKFEQQGFEDGKTTGDLTHDKVRVAIAKENIAAKVDALWKGPCDPKRQSDVLLVHRQAEADEKVRRKETVFEAARHRAEQLQEVVPAYEAPPLPPIPVIMFLIIALGITFGLCLIDLPIFQAIEDPPSRLIIAACMGLALSASCVMSMFNVSSYNRETSVVLPKESGSIWGFVGWIAVSAGFAFVRYATSGDDLELTAGLFGIDLGLISYAKLCAVQHHNRVWVHAERNNGRLQKIKAAEDAKCELESAAEAFTQAQEQQRIVRLQFEDRLKRDFDRDIVKRAAIARWHDGYSRACDENRAPRGVQSNTLRTNQPRNAA